MRRSVLSAPLRLLSGFVVGGAVTALAFAFAWIAWWPKTFYGLVEVGALLGGLSLIGAALGAGLFALRPIRRWSHIFMVVIVAAGASVDPARRFRAALAVDCFYGSSRTEPWCLPGFDWTLVLVCTIAAGTLIGLALGSLGVRPRLPIHHLSGSDGADRKSVV